MSRRVRALPPKALGAAAAAQPVEIDSYFDKVLKYIPADIVAAWVAVTGLVSSARDIPQQAVLWVAFGIGLLLTGWWTWKQASVPGRRPPVRALGAAAQPVEIDSYFDKVLKYIPADIVAAWVAVTGLVSSAQEIPRQTVLWVAFGIGLLLTAWWTWKQASVPGRRPPVTQALISTGAFAVWVFALGGPFQHVPGREVYGSLLLILYTLVAALVNPQDG